MNSHVPVSSATSTDVPRPATALARMEQTPGWVHASTEEREVLQRIAMQRDRLAASEQARVQTRQLKAERSSVPEDAPFAERLAVFVKLHPMATAAAVGVALMIGPRKLLRLGALALPLISKLKR